MYDDEDTGSEDTSATDEEEGALEEDLEEDAGDSESGWHDEEEEDLVENEDHDAEDDEDDDEVEEAEVMWQVYQEHSGWCYPVMTLNPIGRNGG